MFANPELRRNLWSELTIKNMAAIFLMLVAIYFMTYTIMEDSKISYLPKLSLIFYLIFTYIWGTRKASETIVKEVNSNTWSFQIMTPTTPLQMAIGKLLGSTSLVWFGNVVCLGLYLLAYHFDAEKLPPVPFNQLLLNVAVLVLLGLLAHVLPLLMSIHSIRWRHFFEQFDLTFFQMTGVITLIPLYFAMSRRYGNRTVSWYGEEYTLKIIVIVFAAIFLVWGFISIVNMLKTEMGQEPYPVSWLLFTITLIAILYGFNDYSKSFVLSRYWGTILAFFATVCLTYLSLAGESNLALRPHMVVKYYKTKQYKRLVTIMPRSLVTIPIIIVLAVVLSLQFSTQDNVAASSFICMVLAMIMFMLRDFCFVYLWSIFSKGDDKETTIIPVLIALATYTIIPAILGNVGLEVLSPIFMPYFYDGVAFSFWQSAALAIVPPMVEFVLVLAALVVAIKKKAKELELDSEYFVNK